MKSSALVKCYTTYRQDGVIVACGNESLQQFTITMGLLPDTQNCGLRMRQECRECFPRFRALAIPTCIMERAWRTCCDAYRDR